MISDDRPVVLAVAAGEGSLTSSDAVSIGLIVTEGVLNALKHAFPTSKTDDRIVIAYEANGVAWQLSISDNGTGKPSEDGVVVKAGLGTSIINALAQQLGASVGVASGSGGTTLSVIHAATAADFPRAA